MTQIYFHCSNPKGTMVDRRGAAMSDLREARDYAVRLVRSLVATRSSEDWRGWILHVSDDLGDEIFDMPFAFVLGKPH